MLTEVMEMNEHIIFAESFDARLSNKRQLSISGIMTVRNAVLLGYPFLEAILHLIPAVDEFLISDGGSTDETVHYLEKLREIFPKIKLYRVPWKKSARWESFDEAVNFLIEKANSTWIWELHSDEFYHEKDISKLLDIIKLADNEGYNAIRMPCVQYGWVGKDWYTYRTIRVVRKIVGLKSFWGGDDFQIGDHRACREGFTSHNVPPELDYEEVEIMHMTRIFPKSRLEQDRTNVEFARTGDNESRREIYERSKKVHWEERRPPDKDKVLDCLPALMKGMSQELQYKIREELFDKRWLKETTGLEYE